MEVTVECLRGIPLFAALSEQQLVRLQSQATIQDYQAGAMLIFEGDRLPSRLHVLSSGTASVTKTAATGKETVLRTLSAGEIFAAPALVGNGISPATVIAESAAQVLTIEREALLDAFKQTPEIALQIMMVFNQRLQQLHETVHGLVSERAIVRLARLIQYFETYYGTESGADGECLKVKLPYYQMARRVGITYEECARLIKRLHSVVTYSRGGKIQILDHQRLEAIASGTVEIK